MYFQIKHLQVHDRHHIHTGICNPQSKRCRWSHHTSRKLHQQPGIFKRTTLILIMNASDKLCDPEKFQICDYEIEYLYLMVSIG